MELRHLRYFASAAEEGSLGATSRLLNVAQPAISRRIKDLEEELGLELFVRSSQGLRLSRAGEVFYKGVKEVLADLAAVSELARMVGGKPKPSLKVGYTAMVMELGFPMEAIRQLNEGCSTPLVNLSLLSAEEQRSALLAGGLDVGVAYREQRPDNRLMYRDLCCHQALLAISNEHPLARETAIEISDLAQQAHLFPIQLPSRASAQILEALRACGGAGLDTQVGLNERARLSLAAEGMAFSFVTSGILDRSPPKNVVFLPIKGMKLEFTLAAMWPANSGSSLLSHFIELLAQCADRTPCCEEWPRLGEM